MTGHIFGNNAWWKSPKSIGSLVEIRVRRRPPHIPRAGRIQTSYFGILIDVYSKHVFSTPETHRVPRLIVHTDVGVFECEPWEVYALEQTACS